MAKVLYYRTILNQHYEVKLKILGISHIPIAYRKIPQNDHATKNKSTIHFAYEAFQEIKKQQSQQPAIAITLDIKGFFDNINHNNLYNSWRDVLSCDSLQKDHMAIFRSITKYRFVNQEDLEILLNKNWIKHRKELKLQHHMQIFSPKKFRECIEKKLLIVHKNNNDFGIPQGSSISDILANMSLIKFDQTINRMSKSEYIYYRRYSDDILIICNESNHKSIMASVESILQKEGLNLNKEKTKIFRFDCNSNKQSCREININGKHGDRNNKIEYLGFSFDGNKILIRPSSPSKCYRKITFFVRKEIKRIKKAHPEKDYNDIIKDKDKIFSDACIYFGKAFKKLRGIKGGKQGFFNYVKRCDSIMKHDSNIMKQTRNHKEKIKNIVLREISKQYLTFKYSDENNN